MKYIKFLTVIYSAILFTGCNSSSNCKPQGDEKIVRDKAAEIIRCFDEDDVTKLSSLLNERVHNEYDAEIQIREAFDFYEGKSENYSVKEWEWEGGLKDFKYTKKYFDPTIYGIDTDAGKRYVIYFTLYEINDKEPEYLGVDNIKLYEEHKGSDDVLFAEIGGDIGDAYSRKEMPFTRNPEYTNAVKPKE